MPSKSKYFAYFWVGSQRTAKKTDKKIFQTEKTMILLPTTISTVQQNAEQAVFWLRKRKKQTKKTFGKSNQGRFNLKPNKFKDFWGICLHHS